MSLALVRSEWVSGSLVFKDSSGNTIFTIEDGYLDVEASKLKIGDTAVTKTAAQMNALVIGVAAGYKVARGNVAATATATITTGLTTITGWSANVRGGTATKANNAVAVTGAASSGSLVVYRWKHSGASTPTLVAATVAGTLDWVAVGT